MPPSATRNPVFWQIAFADGTPDQIWLAPQHPLPSQIRRDSLSELPTDVPPKTILLVAHLLPGAETPFEVHKRFEEWIAQRDTQVSPYLDVTIRSTRLLLRGKRCVIVAPADAVEDALAAAALFSVTFHALREEADRLEAAWPVLAADAALTHQIGRSALRQQGRINRMTAQFQMARVFIARMDFALQRPDPALAPHARRLFQELVLQADLTTQLRLIDDGVEVGEDLYERANDRLIEQRNFLIELSVEVAILVAILAELAVLVVDFIRT